MTEFYRNTHLDTCANKTASKRPRLEMAVSHFICNEKFLFAVAVPSFERGKFGLVGNTYKSFWMEASSQQATYSMSFEIVNCYVLS